MSGIIFKRKYPIKEKSLRIKDKDHLAEGIAHGAWGKGHRARGIAGKSGIKLLLFLLSIVCVRFHPTQHMKSKRKVSDQTMLISVRLRMVSM